MTFQKGNKSSGWKPMSFGKTDAQKRGRNRISLDATKADFVSVERLKNGVAIRIEGGEKDLGMVIGVGLAGELAHHLARLNGR